MTVKLKWNGNELMLGKTKMAEVFDSRKAGAFIHFYVLGPGDFASKVYESKGDCRQDAEAHVRSLLAKDGVS